MSETNQLAVYKAINAVQAAMAKTGISKDRKNQQQNYSFRGIDDCYAAISPLLAEHRLVIIPRYQKRECVERETKSGNSLFYVTIEGEFDFVSSEDGSKHTARMFGEAMDSADKASNKAASSAFKYLLLQTFCIPTEGDNDADAVTHDVAPRTRQDAKPAQSRSTEVKTPPVTPKEAKEASPQKLRDRMIAVLLTDKKFDQLTVEEYARRADIISDLERVTDWPEKSLPRNAVEMARLVQRIAWFAQGMSLDEISLEEQAQSNTGGPMIEWRDEVAPYGNNKGTRFGELDEKDLRYFVEEFKVKNASTYKKQEWFDKDVKLRAALDAAKQEKGW